MKKRILALFLSVLMLLSTAPINVLYAAGTDAVITVNFIYQSNNAMVAQPYTAQAEIGSSFEKTVAVPEIINYYTPVGNVEVTGASSTQVTYTTSEKQNGADTTTVVTGVNFNIAEVTGDVTVDIYFVAGTAEYTVKHYYQNLENDNYAEPVVVGLTGDIDAYTEAVADTSKTGFYCTGVPQYIIAADGTTTVNLYYNRYYYTVVFDVNGGVNGPDPIYGKYGTEYDAGAIQNPTRAGYDFVGWAPTPSGVVDGDVTYQAQWIPSVGNADYTIVIWGQNANDDEYSYMSSHGAHGAPGDEVTWMPDAYICEGAHTHTANCYILTCTIPEHTHTDACGVSCTHTHTAACYGGTTAANPPSGAVTAFSQLSVNGSTGLKSGYIYRLDCNAAIGDHGDNYYLYYNGVWYAAGSSSVNGSAIASKKGNFAGNHIASNRETAYVYEAKLNCKHVHDDSCYNCGKTAHTHTALGGSCYTLICDKTSHTHTASCLKMSSLAPNSSLWVYDHSDTVTVDADGSTVLNVYFNRKEFTLTFVEDAWRNPKTYGTITDRWGADIHTEYLAICDSSDVIAWSPSGTSHFTNYIGVMPKQDDTYTEYSMSTGNQTMTYYGEGLDGKDHEMFTLKANFGSATVTVEDMYEFEGFTVNTAKSTRTGSSMSGAKFYYNRNSYDLVFYSASPSTPDKTEKVKYQDNLGNHKYDNPVRPGDVEEDAVFVGWYQNPECSGEEYDLTSHTMPSHNIALYAKWVNGLYTVETFTDDTLATPYTYTGYTGKQENVVKYTLADAPVAPSKEGEAFVGWFYMEDGVEKPFSFTMPITKDYQLYPKFTKAAVVNYTVHYYKAGTTEKVADDRKSAEMIGNTVTERAKMGTDLNLVGENYNSYFPDKTSTSVELKSDGMEIIFYYTEAEEVDYTVKYQDANGNDLLDPVEKTTNYSTVVERYVPIENYTSRFFSLTEDIKADGTTVVLFVYDENTVTINYVAVGSGTVSPESETVGLVTGTIGGSTATPDEHYKLEGWYSDAECTDKVGSAAEFVPTEKKEATYYAKFVLDVADYTVRHVLVDPDGTETLMATQTKSGTIGQLTEAEATSYTNYTKRAFDQKTIAADGSTEVTIYYDRQLGTLTVGKTGMETGETAIFVVTGKGLPTDGLRIAVENGKTVTVTNLWVGETYTVTEEDAWTWRYTADAASKSAKLTEENKAASLSFTNTKTKTTWLDAFDYVKNLFTGNN